MYLAWEYIARVAVGSRVCVRFFFVGKKKKKKKNKNEKILRIKSKKTRNKNQAETKALLEMEGIFYTDEFPKAVLACLPQQNDQTIIEQEISNRRDFRNTRIFTIDPSTARDLDDALSVEPLPNGNYRVGVHIADVAHFVQPETALDQEAQTRSTTIYLIQRVLPMLPRLLCEQLCSLNPGIARLAFSIVWEMDSDGNIQNEWVGKSVIGSCAKLSYDHAQQMLDDEFDVDFIDDVPEVHGGYSWDQIINDVKLLNKIAKKLRRKRFDGGAVRINNIKISFDLDGEGNPQNCYLQQRRDSNKLIEEFMLLANMQVAKYISERFPDQSLLRRHPPPNKSKLLELEQLATKMGFEMDTSTSRALHNSFMKLYEVCEQQDDPHIYQLLQLLFTKPMNLAEYFSTGQYDFQKDWRHYALSVTHYTHFTSPIRRYPDVVVHRLLLAAIELDQLRQSTNSQSRQKDIVYDENGEEEIDQELNEIVEKHKLQSNGELMLTCVHANDRKYSSKQIQEMNQRIFLCAMLRKDPVITEGIVVDVKGDRFFEVYLTKYGCIVRIMINMHVNIHAKWRGMQTGIQLLEGIDETSDVENAENGALENLPEFSNQNYDIGSAKNEEKLEKLKIPCFIQMLKKVPLYLTSTPTGGDRPSQLLAFLYY
eukprot:TRINITY_DN2936_c0_g1_i5.p1 TRINITY_DN2936_c0_g1~~TRINITY_DN2936_c0_g1_i5.p1  ORF type:complete len:652 (-),score=77.29 TRINITY_DN2936_c0_g1_i5:2129-4084(-)